MKNKKLSNYTVSSKLRLKKVIFKLNNTGLKFVCVINKKKNLLGTVSDGDIRRALLKNFDLNVSITEVMNKKPKIVNTNYSSEQIKKIFVKYQIRDIPLLDKKGKLIDIISKNDQKFVENIFYIIAGGRGKRMMPLTKYNPKPMLDYMGVPILERILLKIKSEGFKNVVISINYLGKKIQEYFKTGENLGLNINYLKENKEMGTAGALNQLMNISKLPIVLSNADLLTNLKFKDILNYHSLNNSDLTIAVKKHQYQNPFGVIENKGNRLTKINEKPIYNFNINAGVYVINTKMLKFIKKNTYLDMPDLINRLIKKKKKITIFPLHEEWKDLQKPSDLK